MFDETYQNGGISQEASPSNPKMATEQGLGGSRALAPLCQWHEIDTHVLQKLHTEGQVPQQNQKNFVARDRHSRPAEIAHRRAGPSAQSNGFRGTGSTLTFCRDCTPKGRSLSKIKRISWHEIDTHQLHRSHTKGQVPQQNKTDFVARNRHSPTAVIAQRSRGT